jgi:hypothetical protein
MTWRFIFWMPALISGFIFPSYTVAEEFFEQPVRLEAAGEVIDTGKAWGHSSPCIEDIDGDGLKDLILGDFSGKFCVYKNIGKKAAPSYRDHGYIQAGEKDAKVQIYCCIGSQPRFCDLNGDGIQDFISNSYDPGHLFFFTALAGKFEITTLVLRV